MTLRDSKMSVSVRQSQSIVNIFKMQQQNERIKREKKKNMYLVNLWHLCSCSDEIAVVQTWCSQHHTAKPTCTQKQTITIVIVFITTNVIMITLRSITITPLLSVSSALCTHSLAFSSFVLFSSGLERIKRNWSDVAGPTLSHTYDPTHHKYIIKWLMI